MDLQDVASLKIILMTRGIPAKAIIPDTFLGKNTPGLWSVTEIIMIRQTIKGTYFSNLDILDASKETIIPRPHSIPAYKIDTNRVFGCLEPNFVDSENIREANFLYKDMNDIIDVDYLPRAVYLYDSIIPPNLPLDFIRMDTQNFHLGPDDQNFMNHITAELYFYNGFIDSKLYRCGQAFCTAQYDSSIEFAIHCQSKHCPSDNACFHCKHICAKPQDVPGHVETHNRKLFFCHFCCEQYSSIGDARDHVINGHGVPTLSIVLYPMDPGKIELGKDLFVFATCDMYLRYHMFFFQTIFDLKRTYRDTTFKCFKCPFVCSMRWKLFTHLQEHIPDNFFAKSYCLKQLIHLTRVTEFDDDYPSVVLRHDVHLFICPIKKCGYGVSDEIRFEYHLNQIHKLLTKIKCNLCTHVIRHRTSCSKYFFAHLLKHYTTFFECALCQRRSLDQEEIVEHMEIVHSFYDAPFIVHRKANEKPQCTIICDEDTGNWNCPKCEFYTISRARIVEHMSCYHSYALRSNCKSCAIHSRSSLYPVMI